MTRNMKVGLAALASAALAGAAPNPSIETYIVPLTGRAVLTSAHPSGDAGDLAGSGSVALTIDPNARLACYSFDLSVASEPMMAHIHLGAPLRVGPPVVTLFTGTRSRLHGCVPSTHSQLADINADPSRYYVSVDTTEYPDGAVRGQL